jgi:hypothetical protein
MKEPFQQFEWHVSPAYHWQDWLDERGRPVVVPDDGLISLDSESGVEIAWQDYYERQEQTGPVIGPVLDSGPARKYQPMVREHATLFRTFADLDFRDRGAILEFATTYGLLGTDRQEQGPLLSELGHHYALGESHLTWAREICLMREVRALTQCRPEAEQAEIDERYRQHGLDPERRRREDAKKLDWLFNVHLQHVQPRMSFQPGLPPSLSYTPLTLLAAMWLQLALAIKDDKDFQACKFCRALFEISTAQTGFRRHREFCSDSCKTKDYRKRKRTALRLLREGRPLARVAKELETEPATIRRWKQNAKSSAVKSSKNGSS